MTVLGALRSERLTLRPDVERRVNGGIGTPFRCSAAPSSTGRGKFGGRGKSGFSILASLCSAKYQPRLASRSEISRVSFGSVTALELWRHDGPPRNRLARDPSRWSFKKQGRGMRIPVRQCGKGAALVCQD